MAKLPDSALVNIFTLQRSLVECLDSATAMEYRLFQEIGETPETLPELEELQNIRDRLVSSYSRLNNLLLRICQAQPTAPVDMLDLLYLSLEQTQSWEHPSFYSIDRSKTGDDLANIGTNKGGKANKGSIATNESRRAARIERTCQSYCKNSL